MTGHLPECQKIVWITSTHVVDNCICDRLRACEQRVNAEWRDTGAWRRMAASERAVGVQAARDAVAEAYRRNGVTWMMERHVLAAIDGLRGESND